MDFKRVCFLCLLAFSASPALPQEKVGYESWLEYKRELTDYAGGPAGYYSIQDMRELNPGESVCLPASPPIEKIIWSGQGIKNALLCLSYQNHEAMVSGRSIPATDLLKQPDSKMQIGEHLIVRASFLHETALKVWLYNSDQPSRRKFKSLTFFDYDPKGVIHGTFHRNATPVAVSYLDSRSEEGTMYVIGTLSAQIEGRDNELKVFSYRSSWSDIDAGLILMQDLTSGVTTYGGGRVVDVFFPKGAPPEQMTVDFNRAYSFLCAHSSFYNCPVVLVNHIDAELPYGEQFPPLRSD